jgi:hypothetical protein
LSLPTGSISPFFACDHHVLARGNMDQKGTCWGGKFGMRPLRVSRRDLRIPPSTHLNQLSLQLSRMGRVPLTTARRWVLTYNTRAT